MIIDLPENFKMLGHHRTILAYVEDGVLKLRREASFSKTMTEIAYQLKGKNKCYYCKCEVSPEEMTIDHMYSQDFGGPTIPQNLAPSCHKCNADKSNFNEEQYWLYLEAKRNGTKKDVRLTIREHQANIRKRKLYDIPKEWYDAIELSSVIVLINFEDEYKSNRYKKVAKYYKDYNYFQKPIIIDKNGFLLDGFFNVIYAKEQGIKSVPAIKLENVEVVL